ncbi:hypothetical protein [Enterovirga sp. CN4-39]|uniref:hypothetical protein n=1 Tax=Enterovirga sp. CN4-39 TaxID=3400910 RepID=UPI003C11AAAE
MTVNIDKASFWGGRCRELISAEIGRWLMGAGKAPWPMRKPPTVRFVPRSGEAAFDVYWLDELD